MPTQHTQAHAAAADACLAGLNVTVMGLGRFGGGVGVTRWLADRGAQVTVTDTCSADSLADSIAEVSDLVESETVRLELGGHDERLFRGADLVVVNPAVPRPWDNDMLRAARDAGVPLTTEIRLLVERIDRQRVIGVTGSAGKSTTAAMIAHILKRCGHPVILGGNIGGSLLNRLDEINTDVESATSEGEEQESRPWVVLELSSAMLYWLGEAVGAPDDSGWSPHVAVLTNVIPNHLDWHGDMEHYRQTKENIFRWQVDGDHGVRGDEFEQRREIELQIPGKHNQRNALIAMTAALHAANILPQHSAPALGSFKGLPHRLQLIAEHDGVRYYDDSKSTTPQATVLAVAAFRKPSRVHVIVGGYDKGVDLSPIAQLAPKVAGLYAIGQTVGAIVDSAQSDRAHLCESLEAAVEQAMGVAREDEVVLLSPGCASWDQFTNFEQRGEEFGRLVQSHLPD